VPVADPAQVAVAVAARLELPVHADEVALVEQDLPHLAYLSCDGRACDGALAVPTKRAATDQPPAGLDVVTPPRALRADRFDGRTHHDHFHAWLGVSVQSDRRRFDLRAWLFR